MNALQVTQSLMFLLLATVMEVSGDALVRKAIFDQTGPVRIGFLVAGALLLLGYGSSLNLAPVAFERVVGLYIATLFVVWQAISFLAFRAVPTLPICAGGALVVAGGLIITFWQGAAS